MSERLISRNADVRRLRDEGYEVALVAGHLIVTHVPYVDRSRQVRYGTLISELTLSGDVIGTPGTHVVYFAGEAPCDHLGVPLSKVTLDNQPPHPVTKDLTAAFTFSSKPTPSGVYANYYDKMTSYVAILASEAEALDPSATARTYRPVVSDEPDEVFCYLDTNSSRAGIAVAADVLAVPRLAVVGLGGTGSYILDYLAKTPVREIHLFDGDLYLQHNAFRSPGAATLDQLQARAHKVDHLAATYSAMRRGIVAHPYGITDTNVVELDAMSFVFLAVDDGAAKKIIVDHLNAAGVPFVDVGMGLYEVDGRLAGIVRTTLIVGSGEQRAAACESISFGSGDGNDVYDRNIQIAELNALNAAHAVIAWKRHLGFYNDLANKPLSTYVIDTNSLIREDPA
jgi:hypothetical protein